MLYTLLPLLCQKLCRHNRRKPNIHTDKILYTTTCITNACNDIHFYVYMYDCMYQPLEVVVNYIDPNSHNIVTNTLYGCYGDILFH